jgi:actin-like ATPase involved in cell morphogenesis
MRVLAVDFGTSNTVAALGIDGGAPRLVAIDGSPLVPSSVYLADDDTLAVGRDADRQARLDPARFEPNPKRRIDDGDILLGNTPVPVVTAIAAVLRRVAGEVTRQLGDRPDQVRLTHPARWGQRRRDALVAASREAGLARDPALIPEPVAAATHFATLSGHGLADGSALAVYDLGGGTFDVAVVQRRGAGYEVLAEAGLPDLGGLDFDHAIADHIGRTHAADVDPAAWQRLLAPTDSASRRAARAMATDIRDGKEALSRYPHVDIALPPPFADVHLTRTEFEDLIRPNLQRSVALMDRMIRGAGLTAARLAGVYLVGGSSRIPLVARLIQEGLGVTPTTLDQPETSVVTGALYLPVGTAAPAAAGPVVTGPQSAGVPAPPHSFGPPSGGVPAVGSYGPNSGAVPAAVTGAAGLMPSGPMAAGMGAGGVPRGGPPAGANPMAAGPQSGNNPTPPGPQSGHNLMATGPRTGNNPLAVGPPTGHNPMPPAPQSGSTPRAGGPQPGNMPLRPSGPIPAQRAPGVSGAAGPRPLAPGAQSAAMAAGPAAPARPVPTPRPGPPTGPMPRHAAPPTGTTPALRPAGLGTPAGSGTPPTGTARPPVPTRPIPPRPAGPATGPTPAGPQSGAVPGPRPLASPAGPPSGPHPTSQLGNLHSGPLGTGPLTMGPVPPAGPPRDNRTLLLVGGGGGLALILVVTLVIILAGRGTGTDNTASPGTSTSAQVPSGSSGSSPGGTDSTSPGAPSGAGNFDEFFTSTDLRDYARPYYDEISSCEKGTTAGIAATNCTFKDGERVALFQVPDTVTMPELRQEMGVLFTDPTKATWKGGEVWTDTVASSPALYWDVAAKRIAAVAYLPDGSGADLKSWWDDRFGV